MTEGNDLYEKFLTRVKDQMAIGIAEQVRAFSAYRAGRESELVNTVITGDAFAESLVIQILHHRMARIPEKKIAAFHFNTRILLFSALVLDDTNQGIADRLDVLRALRNKCAHNLVATETDLAPLIVGFNVLSPSQSVGSPKEQLMLSLHLLIIDLAALTLKLPEIQEDVIKDLARDRSVVLTDLDNHD
mgnify:CR=1 FL=1